MSASGDTLVNRYILQDQLGAGAAAEVWRATDQRLGRTVAIKILRPQYVSDAEARERFEREARAAAGLTHPNVVDVYDYGATGDTVFIAMQYVDGEDLKRYIAERGRLVGPDAARIALAVCQGLEAAHTHGVIHRDIKPQNILIDRNGIVRITDFGVAKALSGPNLTQQGMTYGTAAYLSPEQATGQPVSPASDVYALGIVLYEMLCGHPPFQGDNAAAVAYQQVYQPAPSVQACNPTVPDALAAIVARTLEKTPALRYPTAAALAAALNAYLANAQRTTPPYVSVVPAQPAPVLATPYGPEPLPPSSPQTAPTPLVPLVDAAPAPAPVVPPAPAGPAPAYQPTASIAAPPAAPAISAAGARRGGFAPWMALPILALLLLACGFGAMQTGLLNVQLGATSAPPTPVLTRVAGGGAEPTATGVDAPTATIAAPAPPTDTAPPAPVPPTDTALAAPVPPTDTAPPAPAATEPPPAPATEPPVAPPATSTGSRGNPVFPTPTVPLANGRTVTLEDVAFVGAYRYQPPSIYEGRTAAWIYGPGTGFATMRAVFDANGQPGGTAGLTLSGMDSEDRAKTPLRILINDQPIFEGPNPLPNDFSPNAGSWGLYTWTFDAGLLHPGRNTLTIENHAATGQIGLPPFVMVDFARLEWETER
jgi:serine/threonine-protein kinase